MRQRKPMRRKKGLDRTGFKRKPYQELIGAQRARDRVRRGELVAAPAGQYTDRTFAEALKATRQVIRKRLRARRQDAATRAADQAYRVTREDIKRRCRNRCENPHCPGFCGARETHHIDKKSHYGRKRQAERDNPDNLIRLGRRCHEWTDEPKDGRRGRLSIVALGDESYTVGIETRAGLVQVVGYTRPKEAP